MAKEDPKFEAFLQKQFAQLRHELDAQIAATAPKKEGKLVRIKRPATWVYGIAAAVIVGVAVPMVLQLNQQKADLIQRSESPALEQGVAPTQAQKNSRTRADGIDSKTTARDLDDAEETNKGYFKDRFASGKKKAVKIEGKDDGVTDAFAGERAEGNLKATPEVEADKRVVKEEAKPTLRAAMNTEGETRGGADTRSESRQSEAAAMAAPAAPAPSAAPASPAASRSMAARDEAPAKPAGRSIAIGDAQEKLRKQNAAEDEKVEMERLWKEFDKDPKSFSKDTKRSARLKVLLARHDTKSKSRAKRVAAESQLSH